MIKNKEEVGYAVLDTGERFEIKIGYYYGTHVATYREKIPLGLRNSVDIWTEHLAKETPIKYSEAVHIEAHPDRKFTLSKLVLPRNVKQVYINHSVKITSPIVLPQSVTEYDSPMSVGVSNLAEFKDVDCAIKLHEDGRWDW